MKFITLTDTIGNLLYINPNYISSIEECDEMCYIKVADQIFSVVERPDEIIARIGGNLG